MPLYVKNGDGNWVPALSFWVKTASNTWSPIQKAYVKVGNLWRRFFPTVTVAPVQISAPVLSGDAKATTDLSVTSGEYDSYLGITTRIAYSTSPSSFVDSVSGSSSSSFPTSVQTSPYTVQYADASTIDGHTSYYYAAVDRVQWSVDSKYYFFYSTNVRSYILPSVSTPLLYNATTTGFDILWVGNPSYGGNDYFTNSEIQIYKTSDNSLVTTISLPANNPYTWTGGSYSTSYYAKVKVTAKDSALTSVTSSASGSISTLSPPTLSDPTGIMVWTYNPLGGAFTINWNAVSNATSYDWIVQSTDASYFNSGTVYTNSFTITGGVSGSYPSEYSLGVPNNKTLQVYIQAKAPGYISSNLTQMSPNYSTGDLPARPSNFNTSTTSSSLTVDSFTGGSTYKIVYLYRYASIFSDVSYYASSPLDVTTTQTFTSLPAGTVWEPRVWGTSLGVASGVASWYLGPSYIYADYWYTLATTAPGSVATTVSVSYQLLSSFTARFNWTFVPSSLPTQTQWFWVQYSSWNGSAWVYSSGYFYRVDGSNLSLDPSHSTGRGSISSISGNAVVDRATYWLAEVYSYNYNGSSGSYTYLNGSYVYIP
mgnify:FL=1